jgi:hypothetical protein
MKRFFRKSITGDETQSVRGHLFGSKAPEPASPAAPPPAPAAAGSVVAEGSAVARVSQVWGPLLQTEFGRPVFLENEVELLMEVSVTVPLAAEH